MPSLFGLPFELMSYVVRDISLQDVRSLSLSSKRFQYLLQEPNIAKLVLTTKAKESPEARRASSSQEWALELRRLFKRKEALASVRPFAAAIVAVADWWIYENGALIYLYDQQLRLLDIHGSATTELVVDVRRLLDKSIPESRTSHKFRFRPLYYADGYVSCLYTHAKPQRKNWLVVFNPQKKQILIARPLSKAYKIFVRNNAKFLYYGVYTSNEADGFYGWVLKGYDLGRRRWLEDRPLRLQNMAGSDIGSTVCFDIAENHFYGIASSTSYEVEETERVSYYGGFCFPTQVNGFDKVQWAPKESIWRRMHAEGVIDDRWTFLRNLRDEETGRPIILESRKEWLAGGRSAKRTYYTTRLDLFQSFGEDIDTTPQSPGNRSQITLPDASASFSASQGAGEEPGSGELTDEDWENELPFLNGTARKLQDESLNCRLEPPARDPRMVFSGDDGDASLMFTLNKCYIRSFHPACDTFLDLVDDPLKGSRSQRLRLRGATRTAKAPNDCEEGDEPYRYHEVQLWPPEQQPGVFDSDLADLETLLNPPSHLGNVAGTWDSHSMVYSTGGVPGECSALVLLSFDASIRLAGLQAYPGVPPLAKPAGKWMDSCPGANCAMNAANLAGYSPIPQAALGQSNGNENGVVLAYDGGPMDCNGTSPATWCRREKAMYQNIARGYHFFANSPYNGPAHHAGPPAAEGGQGP